MYNKILVASSDINEAITNWIINNKSLELYCDVITLNDLLNKYEIQDELNDDEVKIEWSFLLEGKKYTNKEYSLLNRITFIENSLFENFQLIDLDYAKREFEAYLGFAFNAFKSPQYQALNGICEKIYSLPQQWQMVQNTIFMHVPEYWWSGQNFNPLANNENVVHSEIFNFLNWSSTPFKKPTGFSFMKPIGHPVFILALGESYLLTSELSLTFTQRQIIIAIGRKLSELFKYFIFECLLFVDGDQITFGCVNIDIVRSSNNPDFNSFLQKNFLKEYFQCLH